MIATVGPWHCVTDVGDHWFRTYMWKGEEIIAAHVQRSGVYSVYGLPPSRQVIAQG